MKTTDEGQVSLSMLLFAQSWEDPEVDRVALRIQPGEQLMTVTSGACNTLGFLLQDPGHIYAVDINASQTYMLELKMAAMRCMTHGDFLSFLGVREVANRWDLYQSCRSELSEEAAAFWDGQRPMIKAGVLTAGRYEGFIALFRKLLRLIQGRKRIETLFENPTLATQRQYFDDIWDTRRFRLIFRVFFNKQVLARRGLSADYFHFDDGSASFAESFYRRTRHVLRDLPIQSNYFVAQYLRGSYRTEQDLPDYLQAQHFETIRGRLGRITPVTGDAKKWMAQQDPERIDCFALSNICELMNQADTTRTFEEVARTACNGARICFRNLMIPRTVPAHLTDRIQRDEVLSKRLLQEDRSFVYARVDALKVVK